MGEARQGTAVGGGRRCTCGLRCAARREGYSCTGTADAACQVFWAHVLYSHSPGVARVVDAAGARTAPAVRAATPRRP